MLQLIILYPKPVDETQFNSDYAKHLVSFREKAGIPSTEKPYSVTRFLSTTEEPPPFFQMFTMSFDSPESFQRTMLSTEMKKVSEEAVQISTGGAPIILIGNQE